MSELGFAAERGAELLSAVGRVRIAMGELLLERDDLEASGRELTRDTTFSFLSDLLDSTAGQRYGGRGHDDPGRSISTPEIYLSVDVSTSGRTVVFLPRTNRGSE
jgi:hypothetical protein